MDHIAHIRIECNKNNEVGVEEKVTEHSKKVAVLVDIYSSPFRIESKHKDFHGRDDRSAKELMDLTVAFRKRIKTIRDKYNV